MNVNAECLEENVFLGVNIYRFTIAWALDTTWHGGLFVKTNSIVLCVFCKFLCYLNKIVINMTVSLKVRALNSSRKISP